MKQIFKVLIVLSIMPTINFGQITLEKSEQCSSLKAKIPPENNYENGYILNLELKNADNSWVKLRQVNLGQLTEFLFDNVPTGEYRVTLLTNSRYDVSKFDLANITSTPIILECRERNLNKIVELNVHPNPTNSSLHIHLNKDVKDQNFTYEILSSTGKLVAQGNYSTSEIDVSSLYEGQYNISLMDEKGIIGVGKFIKLSN